MSTTGPNDPTPRPPGSDAPRSGRPEPWSATDEWPAGWYADPWQNGRERRWTGNAWTAETRGALGPNIHGLGGPPAGPAWPPAEATPAPATEAPATEAPATWWTRRRLVAFVATLAVIAMIVGFTVTYVAADPSDNTTSATLPPETTTPPTQPPTSSTTPSFGSTPGDGSTPANGSTPNSTPGTETPGNGSSGNGSSGNGGSQGGGSGGTPQTDPSTDVLQQMVVRQSDVRAPSLVVPTDGGDSVAGAPTLDLCNGAYPSESLRTARLQVVETSGLGDAVFSTEAVLYRNPAATAQAFAELRSVAAACPSTPVSSPVGEPPITTKFNAAPDAAWPQVPGVERQAYDFTVTDATGTSSHNVAVYLRRGRALVGLYFPTPDGLQPSVAGKTTVPSIVNLFAQRLAAVPGSAIGA